MKLRPLGMSGLQVSELCLGTMNFGVTEWGGDERTGIEVIHEYLDRGGNFIDTADVYSGGVSEEICGMALTGRREAAIIATKGFFPVAPKFGDPPAHPNAFGSSRRHLTHALENSLRRLRTDWIDLYQVHCWDERTPIEETLSTLNDFVRRGLVRYVGLSNYAAWQISESRQLCIRHGWEPFVTAQMQYSLVNRDVEHEVVPVCARYGIGLLPWSPLGGGVLTGKYGRDLKGPRGSRFGDAVDPSNTWRARYVNDRNVALAETVGSVARESGTTPTAVALAWLLGRPQVTSIIIGPKSREQLAQNIAAGDLTLDAGALKRLEEASAPAPIYPTQFIRATLRNSPPAG